MSSSSSLLPFGGRSRLSVEDFEKSFHRITQLLYDTSVRLKDLEELRPFIHEDVTFEDAWQRIWGSKRFWIQLRGFHCAIYFDFTVLQLNVTLDRRRNEGRCIVDGYMNLKQLQVYTYPLRTILIYKFRLTDDGKNFIITDLEELWAFDDMLQHLPIVGRFYEIFRWIAGYFFTIMFFLACAIVTRLPWSTIGK